MVRKSFKLFFLVILFNKAVCQVLNIEQYRIITDTTGLSGSVGFSSYYISSQKKLLSINSKTHLQYKNERNLYLVLLDHGLIKSRKEEFENNFIFHFRFNRKVLRNLVFEAFNQEQFNKILNVRLRILNGCGLRFKLLSKNSFKLYLAYLMMYEYEEEIVENGNYLIYRDLRNSSYLSSNLKFGNSVLNFTLYYQPLMNNVNDFRILLSSEIAIRISKHLVFNTSYNFYYDSFPANGTEKANHNLRNGFTILFGKK